VPGVADKAGSGGALATVLGADGRSAVSSSEGAAPKLADTPSTRPLKPRKRKLGLILGGVVVVVIGSILGLVQYLTPAPILLLAATAPGPDPFGPDFTVGRGALPGTAMVSSLPAGAAGTLSGTTDGLYRSVMGAAACDRAAMVGYFRDRAPLAQAWSAGLDGREAAGYISTLTPTLLRDDTRVTVFGYADGKAEAHQATLQAGTAVLVDGTGMPQVRCAGADPLTPSDDHAGGPTTQGSVWPGYEPGAVITVERGSQASEFGLVDLAGTPFRRPVGTAGERDIAQTPESGRIDGSYSLVTGTATKCVGFSDCADPNSEPYPVSLQVSCSTGCTATSDEWDGPLPMVRSGDRWEIAGSLKPELTCENNAPTTLQLSFQPTAAEVQGGRWSVTRVTGEYRNVMSRETATCIATDLARKITGTRD
jgi:hypothetical protein